MSLNVVTCGASSIVGIDNFGDELLAQTYGDWIAGHDPEISVHHLTVDGHGLLSRETRERVSEASCLFFTGGGYFADGDYASNLSLRRHLRALRNRRVYWTVFKVARSSGVPCAVFGLEVGPLANVAYRSSVRTILRAAERVVVRNDDSRAFVRQLCGDGTGVSVHLDAALAGPSRELAESSLVADTPGALNIGVHVHTVEGELDPDECAALVERIVADLPTERTARLYYFHDQRKQGSHPERSVRAERFFSSAFPDVTAIPYTDPQSTTAAVAEMDLLITSKLHLGIVARSLGVPVLAIGGHPKIRRFYESIGEGSCCGEPEALMSAGLPRWLAEEAGEERNRIPIGEEFRESALGNRAAVREVLSGLV